MEIFEIDQARIACSVAGNGEPLLLVHGFPLDHKMWQHQIENLSRDFQVLAPDLRGFGCSEGDTSGISMRTFADDLAQLVDLIVGSRPIVFCGLSMGGYIGWQFAKHHGERLKALIQCDTRAVADDPVTHRARHVSASSVLESGVEGLAASLIPKLFAPASLEEHPEMGRQIQSTIHATSPATVANAQLAMANRQCMVNWIKSLRAPMMLIVGEQDGISTPQEMQAIASSNPRAQIQVIPECGHMTPMEQPDAFNDVIRDFLQTLG